MRPRFVLVYILIAVSTLFVVVSSAGADSLESRFLQRLSRAQSSAQASAAAAEYDKFKIARVACAIELKEKLVPKSCYELLQLESPLPAERRDRERRLDQLCRSAARDFKVPDHDGAALSPACAAWVKEAREIRAYRAAEDWSGF